MPDDGLSLVIPSVGDHVRTVYGPVTVSSVAPDGVWVSGTDTNGHTIVVARSSAGNWRTIN